MKTIEQLKIKLKSMGATLDEYPNRFYCDAPSGYAWRANGHRSLLVNFATNRESWLAQAIRDELPNLKMGLVKITDAEAIADMRFWLGEDDWGAPADAPEKIDW